MARLFRVPDFNFFVTANVIGAIVYIGSDLGLSQAIVFVSDGDPRAGADALARARRARLAALYGGLAFGALVLALLDGDAHPGRLILGALLIAEYSVQAYSRFLRSPMYVSGEVRRAIRMEAVERTWAAVASVALMATLSLWWVSVGQLAGALYGYLAARRAAGRHRRRLPNPSSSSSSRRDARSVLRLGAPLCASTLATQLYARLDYLVVFWTQSREQTAIYAAMYLLVIAATVVPVSVSQAALAHIPGAGDPRVVQRAYLRLSILIGLVGAVGIAGGGVVLVPLAFGFHSRSLWPLAIVLGMSFPFMFVNSTINIAAPLERRERRLLTLTAGAALVNLALCLTLVPLLGIMGGAWATLATEMCVTAGWFGWGRRHR